MGVISGPTQIRRAEIEDMIINGTLQPVQDLAHKFNVPAALIERDLKALRSVKSKKLDAMVNDDMVVMFFEIFQGYYRDINRLSELSEFDVRTSRDREVKANIIGMICDKRKDQLLLLMKGPVAWNIDRIIKGAQVMNLAKGYPKAIYGEKQKNTHVDIEQTPQVEYKPPTIETSEPEE